MLDQSEDVTFRRGPSSSMPQEKVPGTLLIATDTGDCFVDDTEETRVRLKDSTKLPLSGGKMNEGAEIEFGGTKISKNGLTLDEESKKHTREQLDVPSKLSDLGSFTAEASSVPSSSDPSVNIENNHFSFNIPSGKQGVAAGFGTPSASASSVAAGTNPSVSVEASGPDTAKVFSFRFEIPEATIPSTITIDDGSID